VVDLETGKIISQVEFSKNELFTGNIRVRNDGLYLAELLHGWVLLNKNFRLLEDSYYLSKSFTVLSLSNGMTLYQNGLLLLPETGLKLELGEVKAHPLTNGKTVFVPLDDHMLIISEKGRILSKINFKAEDSFDAVRSDLKIKGFLSGDYYITFSEDDKIIISDINGKNHTWIKIDGYPVSLGSIDSERFYVFYFISNSIDESRYYLEIYNYHLEKIHKQIVLNPDFFAFSPDGYFYIYERFIFEKNNGLIRSYHYPISFSSVNT
jgi:hypothetical protein